MKHSYQFQTCQKTLQEGLIEYRNSYSDKLKSIDEMNAESADFFTKHDVVHVVFGLNTELHQEAMVDYWTILGTTLSFRHFLYYAFNLEEEKEIQAKLGWMKILKTFFCGLPNLLRITIASRKMRRKWDWDNFEQFMEVQLVDIRKVFGIKVLDSKYTC